MADLLDVLLEVPSGEANLQLADPFLVNYYKDLSRRTIMLTNEIGENCYDIIQLILQWNYEDRNIEPNLRQPIKILISSPGGVLEDAQALCSIIELSETPIYGIALSCVASAASLIYLACHRRYALPSAYLVLHKGSVSNVSGSADEVKAFFEDYQKQLDTMAEYYVAHSHYTREEIDKGLMGDWYVRGNEIFEKGLAHEKIRDIGVFF